MERGVVSFSMGPREWAALVGLSILWGGSFLFFRILAQELPPVTIALGRVGLAAIVLNLVVLARGERMPGDFRTWRDFAVMGLLNNAVPFTLFAFAGGRITSGLSATLNAVTPLLTILVAHFLTDDEKLDRRKGVGAAIGFLGVAVLTAPAALWAGGGDRLGEIACLAAATSYAFAGVFGRRLRRLRPLTAATGQITAATLLLLPLSLAIDHPWTLSAPSATAWGALIGIAILSTALAYILFFHILSTSGATNATLVTVLIPASAAALGAFVLGESLGTEQAAGMGLIAIGLLVVDGRAFRLFRAAP